MALSSRHTYVTKLEISVYDFLLVSCIVSKILPLYIILFILYYFVLPSAYVIVIVCDLRSLSSSLRQLKLEGRSVERIPPHRPLPLTLTFQNVITSSPSAKDMTDEVW